MIKLNRGEREGEGEGERGRRRDGKSEKEEEKIFEIGQGPSGVFEGEISNLQWLKRPTNVMPNTTPIPSKREREREREC